MGMRWVRSPQVGLVSIRPESSRVGAGAGWVCTREEDLVPASAESRIESRNRSRCLVWSCLCLSLPLAGWTRNLAGPSECLANKQTGWNQQEQATQESKVFSRHFFCFSSCYLVSTLPVCLACP